MIIHTDPRANITANAYSRSKVALHSEYKLYQFKKETVTPQSINLEPLPERSGFC